MSQDLLERLRLAEQSARRWKALAQGTWALLAVLLLLGFGLVRSQITALRAMARRQQEAALLAEEQAQRARQAEEHAERALQQERKAREQAEKQRLQEQKARKKAEKTSMMQMDQAHILLAQPEWERRPGPRPTGKP